MQIRWKNVPENVTENVTENVLEIVPEIMMVRVTDQVTPVSEDERIWIPPASGYE